MHQCAVKNICFFFVLRISILRYDKVFIHHLHWSHPSAKVLNLVTPQYICSYWPKKELLMRYKLRQYAIVFRLNYRCLLSADRWPASEALSASPLCALSHIVLFTVTFPEITKRKKQQTPKCSLTLNKVTYVSFYWALAIKLQNIYISQLRYLRWFWLKLEQLQYCLIIQHLTWINLTLKSH